MDRLIPSMLVCRTGAYRHFFAAGLIGGVFGSLLLASVMFPRPGDVFSAAGVLAAATLVMTVRSVYGRSNGS